MPPFALYPPIFPLEQITLWHGLIIGVGFFPHDDTIPIITGFQGVTETGDVTTLGRGGSDTTAVAIAAQVKAKRCDIYTDVDGIFTTDPKVVPKEVIMNLSL